jgi:hypothetical protein
MGSSISIVFSFHQHIPVLDKVEGPAPLGCPLAMVVGIIPHPDWAALEGIIIPPYS